jgi:hypothetical protein
LEPQLRAGALPPDHDAHDSPLIERLHEGTEMTKDEVAEAFRAHDSEFLGWP